MHWDVPVTHEVADTILYCTLYCIVFVFCIVHNLASNITGVSVPVDRGRHAMCPR